MDKITHFSQMQVASRNVDASSIKTTALNTTETMYIIHYIKTLLILTNIFRFTVVRHVTGNDKDYLRKIPRVVW